LQQANRRPQALSKGGGVRVGRCRNLFPKRAAVFTEKAIRPPTVAACAPSEPLEVRRPAKSGSPTIQVTGLGAASVRPGTHRGYQPLGTAHRSGQNRQSQALSKGGGVRVGVPKIWTKKGVNVLARRRDHICGSTGERC
jgi:hypothetical protein